MQLKLSPNMMFTFKNEIPIVLKTNAFIREISQFEGNSLDQNLIYFVLATLISQKSQKISGRSCTQPVSASDQNEEISPCKLNVNLIRFMLTTRKLH